MSIETSHISALSQWTALKGMNLQDRRALMKTLTKFLDTQPRESYPTTRMVMRLYNRDVLARRNVSVAQEKARVRAVRATSFINGVKGSTLEDWLIYPCAIPKLDYSDKPSTE